MTAAKRILITKPIEICSVFKPLIRKISEPIKLMAKMIHPITDTMPDIDFLIKTPSFIFFRYGCRNVSGFIFVIF